MIKNKEILLYFVILLVIFYFIISIIFGFYKKNTYSGTVFLGSSTKVTVKGNDIKVYNEDVEIKKQDVKLFYKNDFIDVYIIKTLSEIKQKVKEKKKTRKEHLKEHASSLQ